MGRIMFPPTTRVIVIDDDGAMRKHVMDCLADCQLRDVTEAPDGSKAIPMIGLVAQSAQPFGLIISDWNMPTTRGIDVLEAVRKNPATRETPFMMITSESEQNHVMAAIKLGVDSFLVKPFDSPTFRERLASVYQKRFATK